MNPDFVSAPSDRSVSDAIAIVRVSDLRSQQTSILCVIDDAGVFLGAVSLHELIRSDGEQALADVIQSPTPTVAPETDVPEVARLMTDYNLTAMPVLDAGRRPVGIIAVDDVLELLLPEQWRRRAGIARD